jgi:nucleotide-binding universal stress UspA family protein
MEKKRIKEEEKRGKTREIRNVIVGIDFSEGSLNAMKNAIAIAEKFKAKLTLLFVISPDAKALIGTDEVSKANIISIVEPKLKKLVADCKKELPNNVIKSKIRMGKASTEINAEAKEQGDALIVVGTHGCSGVKEIFIGSSAFRTVSGSSCPVLTVRNGVCTARHLMEILIVIDDTLETLQKLKPAADIANKFYGCVHIVGLYPRFKNIRQIVDGFVNRAEIYMMEHNVRFCTDRIENTKDKKVETVLEYATKNDINLIIIMKEVEFAGDNVFLTPFSERIVHRSLIPILTVDVDEEIYPR